MEQRLIDSSKLAESGKKYMLTFYNKNFIDITVNVNGRIRNALSELNKSINIDNYFSDKDTSKQLYQVYFHFLDNKENKNITLEKIAEFIIENSKMAGVDLYFDKAYIIGIEGRMEEKGWSEDYKNLFSGSEQSVKTILSLIIIAYILSIIKDFN